MIIEYKIQKMKINYVQIYIFVCNIQNLISCNFSNASLSILSKFESSNNYLLECILTENLNMTLLNLQDIKNSIIQNKKRMIIL